MREGNANQRVDETGAGGPWSPSHVPKRSICTIIALLATLFDGIMVTGEFSFVRNTTVVDESLGAVEIASSTVYADENDHLIIGCAYHLARSLVFLGRRISIRQRR